MVEGLNFVEVEEEEIPLTTRGFPSKYKATLDNFRKSNLKNAKIVLSNSSEASNARGKLVQYLIKGEKIKISSIGNIVYLMRKE